MELTKRKFSIEELRDIRRGIAAMVFHIFGVELSSISEVESNQIQVTLSFANELDELLADSDAEHSDFAFVNYSAQQDLTEGKDSIERELATVKRTLATQDELIEIMKKKIVTQTGLIEKLEKQLGQKRESTKIKIIQQ